MKKTIKITDINVPVLFIEENDQVTAHCPVLDIATCGENVAKARKNFEEMIYLFFEELCKMGTLEDVLLECGWKKASEKRAEWVPPKILESATENVKVPCPV
ncbi:MAG: hypothetical protein JXQ30_08530 [Spirochaetes bacterium]|nr:hypothetical protein [Spirochaetota bacterium]